MRALPTATRFDQIRSDSAPHLTLAIFNSVSDRLPPRRPFDCDDQTILRRLARIEKNYAQVDLLLGELEQLLPAEDRQLAEQSEHRRRPRKPR